ncbi:MAG: nucleotide exchange factor GrpE [Promethearchaeota archaeon]
MTINNCTKVSLKKAGKEEKMFENGMFDFFSGRRALEDPRKKVVITREEYDKLLENRNSFDLLSEKFKDLKIENQELKEEIQLLREEKQKFENLEEEKQEILNSLARARADFENYRKLTERQNKNYKLQATAHILKKIISHHDDLVRSTTALNSIQEADQLKKGLEMVIKNLEKILTDENVVPMNCVGEKFDPYKHEVIMVKEDNEITENTILEELDEGYFYNNEVLRPAKVVISKKPTTVIK